MYTNDKDKTDKISKQPPPKPFNLPPMREEAERIQDWCKGIDVSDRDIQWFKETQRQIKEVLDRLESI
jgi:hypothetical protein